jgi:hypothetical protein
MTTVPIEAACKPIWDGMVGLQAVGLIIETEERLNLLNLTRNVNWTFFLAQLLVPSVIAEIPKRILL